MSLRGPTPSGLYAYDAHVKWSVSQSLTIRMQTEGTPALT
jgi:hypothetical protein